MTAPEPEGRHTDAETGERFYEYPPTGELLDSVTTIISGTDSKPWLRGWYGRTAMAWAVDNLDLIAATLRAAEGTEAERRQAAVDLGKDAAERERNVKRDAGSYVHDLVERLIWWAGTPGRAGASIALPDLPEHLVKARYNGEPLAEVTDWMISGFVNWVSDFSPRLLATEMPVYNQPLGIAGTLDLIAALDGYGLSPLGDRVIPCPGGVLTPCIDVKSGALEATWKEQLAAYRRMNECRPTMLDGLRPMPETDCGMVLHLRPEYPDGYLLMLVAGLDDYDAWRRFQAAAMLYRERAKVKDKPGRSVRPLRADGTMPGLRVCDLAGEGWGRALAPLATALGADAELEQLARFSQKELLAVKGIGPKLAADIRIMLADYGIIGAEGDAT